MDQLTKDEVLEVREMLAERRASRIDPIAKQKAANRDAELAQLSQTYDARLDAADGAARAAIIAEMDQQRVAIEQKYA